MTAGLFDATTGEIFAAVSCAQCAQAARELAEMERDLQRVERELRLERREVARVKTELEKQKRQHVEDRIVQALFDYWVKACNKNPKKVVLGEKRRAVIVARLKEHDPEYIARAIDWIAASEWHRENGKQDIELVCRDEVKLENCYEQAERFKVPTLLGPAWIAEYGARGEAT